jgi:hypothetical protein
MYKHSYRLLFLTFAALALVGCATTTAFQSQLIIPPHGTLGTKEVVVDNPTSKGSFDQSSFIPLPMANLIALKLAKRFPSIKIIRPQHYATITRAMQRPNLVFSPNGLGGDYVELQLEVLSWNPGSAVERFLSSGISNSGEASLSIKATLIKISPDGVKSHPVSQSIFTTASTGYLLYTGTAESPWARAASEIAKWVGNQL